MAELEIHREHEGVDDPIGQKVGILASTLAVFLAVVTIQSHRAHTEAILHTAKATDQWNFYQSKKMKAHNLEVGRDVLKVLAPETSKEAVHKEEQYEKEISRYNKDSDTAKEDAENIVKAAEKAEHKATGFDIGEGLLEIGLVLSSLYFIGRKMIFPVVGVITGIAGIIAAAAGLMAH
jgi:hypothetical protein